MCENLKPDRLRCEPCRTINLANQVRQTKPDMQMYEKCSPTEKIKCPHATELPLHPTCIRICKKEDYQKKSIKKLIAPVRYYQHGKLLYLVKAGLLVGAVCFTYNQGVWGNQQDVIECIRRWQEYIRSLNTRRPPTFDQCGNVIKQESSESIVAPLYSLYKSFVTTCFSGVVKVPVFLKCAYLDYLKALEKKEDDIIKERRIKKNSI